MFKRILPFMIIMLLVCTMLVQALEHKKDKQVKASTETSLSKASDEDLNELYNSIMSSQIEEPEEEEEDVAEGLEIGSKAPDFELTTLTGKKIRLADFKGKRVMINFFATWCYPCKIEMPVLEKFYQENHDDIEILAINIDTKSDVKGYVKKLNLSFPILLDEKGVVDTQYQVLAIPSTYIVDEKGIIINIHYGALNDQQLEKLFK